MKISFSRRVHFSCAHRYANPQFSDEKNRDVFGACFNSPGHGHNYQLVASFSGPIDAATGMIINLKQVDEILNPVVKTLDHKHLNHDVAFFKDHIPTTENIARYCYLEIDRQLQALGTEVRLAQVRLYEMDDLWVDIHPT